MNLFALIAFLAQPNFIYPVQAPQNLTGSFGGYRLSHHHAGLDLYASEAETTPILAAADGTIYKIRQNNVGYGNAIYMKHDDGYTTIYAHLSAFGPQLAPIVKEMQAEKQSRESTDFFFEKGVRVKVKQGDVIGYIGTSGTDLVHLHFEVRQKNQPLNPLTNGLKMIDTQPPRIAKLAFRPRKAKSSVEGEHTPRIYSTEDMPSVIHISGDVAVSVAVEDHMEGSDRILQPLAIEFFIDDEVRHVIRYDQVTYGKRGVTELDYDSTLRASGDGLFHRLTREGPLVETQQKGGKANLTDLKPGRHKVRIHTVDAAQNEDTFTFDLQVDPPKFCPIKFANLPQGKVTEASPRQWLPRAFALPLDISSETQCPPLKVNVLRNGKPLKTGVTLSHYDGKPALVVDVPTKGESDFTIGYQHDGVTKWHQVRAFSTEAGAKFESSPVTLTVGKEILQAYPTELVVEQNPGAPGMSAESPLYRFTNAWLPARDASRVSVKRPFNVRPHEGLALFLNEGTKWWYLGREEKEDGIAGASGHLVGFALMRDRNSPQIDAPFFEEHPAGYRLIVKTYDEGSGVRRATLKIDNKPCAFEWQSSYKRIVYLPLNPPTPGRHQIEVTAEDYVGHTTTYRSTIMWP